MDPALRVPQVRPYGYGNGYGGGRGREYVLYPAPRDVGKKGRNHGMASFCFVFLSWSCAGPNNFESLV